MSSHAGSGDRTPIVGLDQLVAFHAQGEKSPEHWRVGTEHEKFAYARPNLDPLHYRGNPGIRTLLESMASRSGWTPSFDGTEIIALTKDGANISLEPGGQFELSGTPHATIHGTRAELDAHLAELAQLTALHDVRWLWMGYQPVHPLTRIDWMPKRRYGIMREYLPRRGSLARHMMQATATVQANFDYGDERDMGDKLRTAMGLSSIVTAMFANSPFQHGKPSGMKTVRATVWSATDADRQGLLPFVFDGEPPSYERWVQWGLDVPMFFIRRDDELLPAGGLSFRRFWQEGFMGHRPTLEDWETHVSTLFPDVRLKTYLEVRTADCVPPQFICALPALWKGLLYSKDQRIAAWDLVKGWTFDERLAHREAVPRAALAAPVPKSKATTKDLAVELLAIATSGLEAQALSAGHPSEAIYLEPLAELTRAGRVPADLALGVWQDGLSGRDLMTRLIALGT